MDNTARFKAAIATAFIGKSQTLYLRTGNPIHLWSVYLLARQGGVPIPDWVLEYLDKAARVLTAPNGPTSPTAVADALGLATKGGPSKTRQAEMDQRDLAIVEHIEVLKDLPTSRRRRDLDLQDDVGIMQRVADDQGHWS